MIFGPRNQTSPDWPLGTAVSVFGFIIMQSLMGVSRPLRDYLSQNEKILEKGPTRSLGVSCSLLPL